jgi:hypothetical protein
LSKRHLLLAALAVVLAFPACTDARPRTPANLVWGVTLDNDAGISHAKLAQQVDALASLPVRPLSRVVMDIGTKPVDYAAALPAIHRVSGVMAELGDSSEVKKVSVPAYTSFVQRLVDAYKHQVDVWEVGNEVNGEWVGTPAQELARVRAAYDIVKRAGGQTALTLYYNPNCWSKRSNELFTWLANNVVPQTDYVTISYYPGDCNGYWPSAATWQTVFDKLHARFPQAKLMFGESGFSSPASAASAAALLDRYAAVKIAGDNYVGGFFWWTWAEDAVPKGSDFWNAYAAAERAA